MTKCFAKCFYLKIIQLQLYFLIWPQTSETLTDRLTDLGQNVTINCDLDVKEVYWVLLNLPDPPVMILRSFSSPFYYNEQFRHKYSVQYRHNLLISNVTHKELGVYYCVNTATTRRKFSNGTRLYINDQTTESQTCFEQKPSQCPDIYTLISALINGVLIIVVIGLLVVLVRESKKTRKGLKQFQDIDPVELMNVEQLQDQDSTQIQYVRVEFPTLCKRF